MKVVMTNKSGEQLYVEVATDQAGWNFPDGFRTRINDDGKEFYQIPVSYTLLEKADIPAEVIDAYKKLGVTDPVAEFNAGIKLAQGDLAKEPYRVRKSAKLANLQDVANWLIDTATDEQRAKWKSFARGDKAALAWAAEQMNA